MTERGVSIERAGARLAGTATLVGGRSATVLMLHGSGPLDRDENMRGQHLDVFNTLAAALSRAGVSSVRYDKRGCGASTGDFTRAGFSDFVADAIAWVDFLTRSDFCDPAAILLLGHSEGCLAAARVIAERRAIAGAMLLCPFVEPMESVLMRQAAQVAREIDEAPGVSGFAQRALVRLLGRPVDSQRRLIEVVRRSSTDTLRRRGQTISARWLRELLATDVAGAYSEVECPLLLVGGGKDLQCEPGDVDRIAELVRGPVETHVIPDLTHLLRRDPGRPSLMGAHSLLGKPVDSEVLERVAAWASARTGR
jgi:uncharacterized protein